MDKNKKSWYKKWWVWVIIIFVLIGIGGGVGGNRGTTSMTNSQSLTTEKSTVETKPAEEKWDVEAAYAKLTDGMTKAEVETALGKTSDNCSETSAQYVGTIETCNYGGVGDNGMIMVQYQNGKMSTKSKSKF